MEEERQRIYTVIAVVALVAIVLSCAAGALAGGVTGYFVGQRQGAIAAERAVGQRVEVIPGFEMPIPLPEPDDELPYFDGPPAGMVGAVILEVIAGMPAEQAGLQVGDIITAIDQTPIDRNHSLPAVISQYVPGDRVTVTFWRNDRQESLVVRLAENPDAAGQPYLGVRYQMNMRFRMDQQGG